MRNDGDYINGKCCEKIQAKLVKNGKEGLGLRVGVKKSAALALFIYLTNTHLKNG